MMEVSLEYIKLFSNIEIHRNWSWIGIEIQWIGIELELNILEQAWIGIEIYKRSWIGVGIRIEKSEMTPFLEFNVVHIDKEVWNLLHTLECTSIELNKRLYQHMQMLTGDETWILLSRCAVFERVKFELRGPTF